MKTFVCITVTCLLASGAFAAPKESPLDQILSTCTRILDACTQAATNSAIAAREAAAARAAAERCEEPEMRRTWVIPHALEKEGISCPNGTCTDTEITISMIPRQMKLSSGQPEIVENKKIYVGNLPFSYSDRTPACKPFIVELTGEAPVQTVMLSELLAACGTNPSDAGFEGQVLIAAVDPDDDGDGVPDECTAGPGGDCDDRDDFVVSAQVVSYDPKTGAPVNTRSLSASYISRKLAKLK